jgi:hypothetical protein
MISFVPSVFFVVNTFLAFSRRREEEITTEVAENTERRGRVS